VSETNDIQEQVLHALFWVVATLLLIGTITLLTSCQSPVNIDTPRTAKPDITWNTTTDRQTGQVQSNVAKVNNIEPDATFYLTRTAFVYADNIPTTASVCELAYPRVVFKDTTVQHPMSLTAGGAGYQNYRLYSYPGGAALAPYIVVKDVSTAIPVQFNIPTYTLSDNKLEWLGKVEITSHKNGMFFSTAVITRGQPLVVRWTSDALGADGAELTVSAYTTTSRLNPDGSGYSVSSEPVILKKTLSSIGVSEAQFTADEINTLPAEGNFTIRLRYFKAKTANNDKVVLVSESVGVVYGVVK
jgi:hypothetical protein